MSTKRLIPEQESAQLAFLPHLEADQVCRIICSFLNGSGGELLIGIGSTDEPLQPVDEAIESELTRILLQGISPLAPFSVGIGDPAPGLISIRVIAGTKPPYSFSGKIYVRRDTTTSLATPDDISLLIDHRQRLDLHWERQTVFGLEWKDFDRELISNILHKAAKKMEDSVAWKDEEAFMTHFGLIQNGLFTNAALILFGKNPSRWLPQSRVRMVEMPDGKTGGRYSRDLLLEGNLFTIKTRLETLLRERLPLQSEFSSQSWDRADVRAYPIEALDEGVMNALIHRDFSNMAGSVVIEWYPDRIVIMNHGGLPYGWTTQTLKKNHLSLPRNPDIAHICFLAGWIEKLGRGTLLILDHCKAHGLKQPRWEDEGNFTALTFFAKSPAASTHKALAELSKRQMQLLALIRQSAPLTVSQMLHALQNQVSDRTVRNDLNILIVSGWIEKKGAGPQTRYGAVLSKKS